MVWTLYVPIATLVVFSAWMLFITRRAYAVLGAIRVEVLQLLDVLTELRASRRFAELSPHWLGDVHAFVRSNSYPDANPLIDLIDRFWAMRELATPDLSAALATVGDREADKLEPARETPGTLLLLGIMGTVVGMVIALSTFGVVGLDGDGPAIDVGRIVGSMFLAFISTGVALFLSVLVRTRLERVAARQAELLTGLEDYAFTRLAPLLLPKNELAVTARLHETTAQQQERIGASLDRASETLAAFSDAIDEARRLTHALGSSVSDGAAALSDAGQRVSTDLNEVGQRIASDLSGVGQRLSGELNEAGQRLTTGLAEASTETRRTVADALLETGSQIERQRGALEQAVREARQSVEQDRRANQQQAETLYRRLAETATTLETSHRDLVASLDAMTQRITTRSAEQTVVVEALREDLSRLAERVVAAQERHQQQVLESQERHQRSFLETVQTFLQEQFAELARGIGLRRRGR